MFDVTQKLYDLHGKVLMDADKVTPLTARKVLEVALITRAQQESMDVGEQIDRFVLAHKAVVEDELDLTSEQIVKIKKWISTRYAPLITGQMALLLEGKKGLGPDAPDEM